MSRINESFDRAFFHLFSIRKFLVLYLSIALSSLLFVGFRQIAYGQPFWVQQILFFLPLFLGMLILYSAQILLTHSYLREYSNKTALSPKRSLLQLIPCLVKLSYFLMPLIFFYLILLLLMGTFLLLTHIPVLGVVFKTLLAFIPFLLNLSLIGIFLALFFLSFYVIPLISMDTNHVRKRLMKRLQMSPFMQFLYLIVPLVIVGLVWRVLMFAVEMSVNAYLFQEGGLEILIQSFSLLIPFAALFTLPLLFLWHFAAESALVESN